MDEQGQERGSEDPGWPIGFLVLVGAATLYLGWRLIQALGWLFDRIG